MSFVKKEFSDTAHNMFKSIGITAHAKALCACFVGCLCVQVRNGIEHLGSCVVVFYIFKLADTKVWRPSVLKSFDNHKFFFIKKKIVSGKMCKDRCESQLI